MDNPITKVRGIVKLQEQASPPEQVLLDQIADLNRRLANIEQPSIPTSIEGSSDALRDDDVLITFEFRPGTREGNKSTLISVLRVMTRRITWDKTGTTVQLIVPSHERHNVNRVLNEYRRFIKE